MTLWVNKDISRISDQGLKSSSAADTFKLFLWSFRCNKKRKSDIFSAILNRFCFLLAIALFRFVQGILFFQFAAFLCHCCSPGKCRCRSARSANSNLIGVKQKTLILSRKKSIRSFVWNQFKARTNLLETIFLLLLPLESFCQNVSFSKQEMQLARLHYRLDLTIRNCNRYLFPPGKKIQSSDVETIFRVTESVA